ncbi:hypothetical protein TNCV_2361401 [Trichonephila clavipes]|nr:hypothetical protein TNCV_2361401 [Trichonephila clavipes]
MEERLHSKKHVDETTERCSFNRRHPLLHPSFSHIVCTVGATDPDGVGEQLLVFKDFPSLSKCRPPSGSVLRPTWWLLIYHTDRPILTPEEKLH